MNSDDFKDESALVYVAADLIVALAFFGGALLVIAGAMGLWQLWAWL